MLHILLLILKIFGIIFAVIAVFLMFVLVIPFSYTGKGKFEEKASAVLVAKWILNIVYFKLSYINEEITYVLRIFGIPFFRGTIGESEEEIYKDAFEEQVEDDLGELLQNFEEHDFTFDRTDDISENSKKNYHKTETNRQDNGQDKKKQIGGIGNKSGGNNIQEYIKRIRKKIRSITEEIRNLKKTISNIRKFLKSEKTKIAYYYARDIIKKIYHHMKPSKLEADVVFGFESPDRTGKMLAFLGVLYGTININPEKVSIVPDFQRERLEGKIFMKGNFVLIYVIVLTFQLYFKKEIHYIIERFS